MLLLGSAGIINKVATLNCQIVMFNRYHQLLKCINHNYDNIIANLYINTLAVLRFLPDVYNPVQCVTRLNLVNP